MPPRLVGASGAERSPGASAHHAGHGEVVSPGYSARMVNLTRIYTRTGDGGQTRLGDMSLTTKNDLRLHAYADVDEANAHLGLAVAAGVPPLRMNERSFGSCSL